MTLNDVSESAQSLADIVLVDVPREQNTFQYSKGGGEDDDWSLSMRLALNGDKVAYFRLLQEIALYAEAIARKVFLRSNLGNTSVDDVVQDTLLTVHLKRDLWDRQRRLKPWVGAIAFHKSIDELRRAHARQTVNIDYSRAVMVDPFQDLQTGLAIAHLFERLTPRQRDIVVSISLEGHSVLATAERLSMSKVAVRVALHRSLKKMAALAERCAA